jgi:ribosomal protein L17
MKDVLEEAGIEITKDNKKEIDRIIHGLVDVAYKDCSPTWKKVKEHIKTDEAARNQFIKDLKKQIKAP